MADPYEYTRSRPDWKDFPDTSTLIRADDLDNIEAGIEGISEWSVAHEAEAEGALLELNDQTGTTYTLVLTDAGKLVSMNNASPNTLTVPTNASVPFPVGSKVVVRQQGAGSTTLAGAGGVTVNTDSGSLVFSAQHSFVVLVKVATNTWEAVGALGNGSPSNGIPATTMNAKGDLLVATADDTVTRLPVGADDKVLTARSSASEGVAWETPSGGGGGGQWCKLTQDATAGDTVLHVDGIPPRLALFGTAVVVGVGQTDCHLDTAVRTTSTTITLAHPLVANRLTGDYIWSYQQTEPLPFTYLGGRGGNVSTYASANVAAWNRIMEFGGYWDNVGTVLMLLDGGFGVDDSIFYSVGHHKILTTMEYAPAGGFYSFSVPYAVGGGDFKSLLRQYDQAGNVATINNFTADGACILDSFFIDCRGDADSIGLMHSPQQPGWMRNMRFLGSRGIAAYIFGGQNYWSVQNNQYDDNFCGFYNFHNPQVIRDVNITSPFPIGGVQYSCRMAGQSQYMEGVALIETVPAPGPAISLEGSHAVLRFSTSGLAPGTTGVIVNIDNPVENPAGNVGYEIDVRCEQTEATVKVIRDVQRNFSIQAALGNDIPDRTVWVRALGDTGEWYKKNVGWSPVSSGVPHAA